MRYEEEIDEEKGEDLLNRIKHRNIIKYYGYFVDDGGYLNFVLEFYKVCTVILQVLTEKMQYNFK